MWAVFTAIPAITSAFHFYRGVPVDGVVFAAVALVCALGRRTDAAGTLRRGHTTPRSAGANVPDRRVGAARPERRTAVRQEPGEPGPHEDSSASSSGARPSWWRLLAATVLLMAFVVVLMVWPRYSAVDTLVFAALGLAVLAGAARRPRGQPRSGAQGRPARRAVAAWSSLVVALSACELVTYFLSSAGAAAEQRYPPLSDAMSPLLESRPGRLLFLVCWLLAGVGLMHCLGILPRYTRRGHRPTRHGGKDGRP